MTEQTESLDVETIEDETKGVHETPTPEGSTPSPDPSEGVTTDATPDEVGPIGPEDSTGETPDEEPETFDRPYVEKLRREAAESRVKAKRADDLAAALWTARVTATGRLADPTDLVMPDDADPLDEDAIASAVDDLLERKPHLASRKPRGDVGAGATPAGGTVDLAALMRSRV